MILQKVILIKRHFHCISCSQQRSFAVVPFLHLLCNSILVIVEGSQLGPDVERDANSLVLDCHIRGGRIRNDVGRTARRLVGLRAASHL